MIQGGGGSNNTEWKRMKVHSVSCDKNVRESKLVWHCTYLLMHHFQIYGEKKKKKKEAEVVLDFKIINSNRNK